MPQFGGWVNLAGAGSRPRAACAASLICSSDLGVARSSDATRTLRRAERPDLDAGPDRRREDRCGSRLHPARGRPPQHRLDLRDAALGSPERVRQLSIA